MQLTEAIAFQAGSAFDVTPVDVTRFHTRFRYVADGTGQGMTFTLQTDNLRAVGDIGGALGYGSYYTPVAMPHSFALALSISNNQTGISTGGTPPRTPYYGIVGGVDLGLGHPIDVDLSYDGTTLTESLIDASSGATYVHTYAVDIPAAIGSRYAFAGFTASTGGNRAVQQIRSWTYAETRSPAAPSSLSAAATSPYAVNLAWVDNADDELGYAVEGSTDGGLTFHQVATAGIGATSLSLAGLTPGTTYAFRVEAFKGPLTSPPSNVAVASTPPLVYPPQTPTFLYATLVTSDRIDLAWVDNAGDEDGYRVLRKTGTDGAFNLVASLPANSAGYNDRGLSPSTAYEYHVLAYNAGGYSDFTGVGVTTLGAGIDLSGGFAGPIGWALNGSTKVVGSALRLTDGGTYLAGSAFATAKVDTSRFQANFRMRSTLSQRNGLTFVLQAAGYGALGDIGGAMGYGTYYGANRMPNSVAVKFGLDGTTGLYLNGALPAGGLPLGPGIDPAHDVLSVSITYDGSRLSVTEFDETTGATATQVYTVDIPGVVGSTNAWAGFTGSTGSTAAVMDILSFTYAPTRPPAAPTNLAAAATAGKITLGWADHADNETGFDVERSADGGLSFTLIGSAGANAGDYVDTGVISGRTYVYRVRARNGAGTSGYSNLATATAV